ncbi:MAG TPA: hypothetical protein VMT67_08335 [Terriglobales bacterium]|nr:hypothetical protein [Terriglobales bacterium]
MPGKPQTPRRQQRSTRVKLRGAIPAQVLLESGREIQARLSQLSENGGLLSLENPLDEGIQVATLFKVGSTSFRCRSKMMFPMWATRGCLQPFRFLELSDENRAGLTLELESLMQGGPVEARTE